MKRMPLAIALVIPFFAPVAQEVHADDFTISPRLEVGYVDHRLESPDLRLPDGTVFPAQEFVTQHFVVRAGATASYGRLYIDGYLQRASKDEDFASVPAAGYREAFDGDRDEWSLGAGYQVLDQLSLFAGARASEIGADGGLGGEVDVDTRGVYAGAAYAWPIGARNVVTVNAAVTFFDVEYFNRLALFAIDADGSGSGYKVGLTWTSALTDALALKVSVDTYAYSFDDLEDPVLGDLPGEVEESEIGGRVGLSYSF